MLSTTIPSYLYQQYADDDDLQAFVLAYNEATQSIITWFATVGLPYYPGLSGDLLDWVAYGLYGLQRTSLAGPASAVQGPLNTEALDTNPLNSIIQSTQPTYTLSDDIFQRILTWDFYKGDGKRFCARWLKRRVMRFLVGVNGVDPQPSSPSFTVGAENTAAIGVSIAGNVLTVTIYPVLLAQVAQVSPTVLTLFQAAFEGGALDLPIQFYSYVVNIVTAMAATIAPKTLTSTGRATTQTTGVAEISVAAGSGSYTFAWHWQSGGAGITINAPPTTGVVSFTATGMTPGTTYSGIASCLITDSVTSQTAIVVCSVSITCQDGENITTGSGSPLTTGNRVNIIT